MAEPSHHGGLDRVSLAALYEGASLSIIASVDAGSLLPAPHRAATGPPSFRSSPPPCRCSKDMIITGDENVYSIEVEQALLKHLALAVAAVIGVADERWGQKVTGIVALREGAGATEDGLRQHCRGYLAGFKVTEIIYCESVMPVTPVEKIQKHALRARVRTEG